MTAATFAIGWEAADWCEGELCVGIVDCWTLVVRDGLALAGAVCDVKEITAKEATNTMARTSRPPMAFKLE
jgi:hypothetical protein